MRENQYKLSGHYTLWPTMDITPNYTICGIGKPFVYENQKTMMENRSKNLGKTPYPLTNREYNPRTCPIWHKEPHSLWNPKNHNREPIKYNPWSNVDYNLRIKEISYKETPWLGNQRTNSGNPNEPCWTVMLWPNVKYTVYTQDIGYKETPFWETREPGVETQR